MVQQLKPLKLLLIFILLYSQHNAAGCDCNYQPFLHMAKQSDLCIKAEVIKTKENHYQLYPTTEKILVRVLDNYNCTIDSDTLQITAHSWMNSCVTSGVNGFHVGDIYYFNLEDDNELRLGTCGESIIQVFDDGSVSTSYDSLLTEIEIDIKLDKIFKSKSDRYQYTSSGFDKYLNSNNNIGEKREYYENGNLKSIYTIDSIGRQKTGVYFSIDNRCVSIRNYKNNVLHGNTNYYFVKKNFTKKINYKNGVISNFKGRLLKSYPYHSGCINGVVKVFRKGKISEKLYYENGEYKGCDGCEEF